MRLCKQGKSALLLNYRLLESIRSFLLFSEIFYPWTANCSLRQSVWKIIRETAFRSVIPESTKIAKSWFHLFVYRPVAPRKTTTVFHQEIRAQTTEEPHTTSNRKTVWANVWIHFTWRYLEPYLMYAYAICPMANLASSTFHALCAVLQSLSVGPNTARTSRKLSKRSGAWIGGAIFAKSYEPLYDVDSEFRILWRNC